MDVILGVDLGERNIGLAKSDPLGIGATALGVIQHTNREQDAQAIVETARQVEATMILVGQPLNADGSEGPAARHAAKTADAIREIFDGEVKLWDESHSTQIVKGHFIEMNVPQKKRRGHLDAHAAAWIVRDYLDHYHDNLPRMDALDEN